ncbi:UDP-galactopyranose mutase [Achromobacter sp. E1]|uniref:UDP-galactopyranose mutase n=1 Tax=Achromobacter sp. E1 TaxID=3141581 RepID=UPI0030CEA07E
MRTVDASIGGAPHAHASASPQSPAANGWLTRERPAILCFSHLRWNFVHQRPQHLMTRFARGHAVFYIEEPVWEDAAQHGWLESSHVDGVTVITPHVAREQAEQDQRRLLGDLLHEHGLNAPVLWYYTPMSLPFTEDIEAGLVVYDCMDELSAFRGAPPDLVGLEHQLLARADVVFTGGHSLYEAKRRLHPNVHAVPSSVDRDHFARARTSVSIPSDLLAIPTPRLGFYGVLDERFDTGLLATVAGLRPDWQFVLIGPVVKIDPATLPQAPNIHYLGARGYDQLPGYLAGWDVALMPFAMNESTRYISPTKTPEYLAAGRPVVSTPIADVVRAYGGCPIVQIAANAADFAQAISRALASSATPDTVAQHADRALEGMSWERSWEGICDAMNRAWTSSPRGARHGPAGPGAVRMARKMPSQHYDFLIVGAGHAGSVLAERLARGSGKRVMVVDRRPHIAGNAYDFHNESGLLVHRYGPHIFHTNSDKVLQYLSQFTQWRPYEHRVLARADGMLVPMPINLTTLERLNGRSFTAAQAEQFLQTVAEPASVVSSAEDYVVSQIGRVLYEKFFRGYTRKQWGLDPSQLDRSVAARVPTRLSRDDRYFTDRHQCMPLMGYTRMFERMLDHSNISLALGMDFEEARSAFQYDELVYTGPIDEYFGYCFGPLPYRSLKFRHETLDEEWHQPVGVVNYPAEDVPYTRITEYKHLTGQRHPKTAVTYEYPSAQGDPYYPVPRPENAALFRRYQELADACEGVHFVGRLATYRYYNMDQVVAQALATYEQMASRQSEPRNAMMAE